MSVTPGRTATSQPEVIKVKLVFTDRLSTQRLSERLLLPAVSESVSTVLQGSWFTHVSHMTNNNHRKTLSLNSHIHKTDLEVETHKRRRCAVFSMGLCVCQLCCASEGHCPPLPEPLSWKQI